MRPRNWDSRLVAWAIDLDGTPFEWGRIDCLSAALTAGMFMVDEVPQLDAWDGPESFADAVDAVGGPLALLESVAVSVGRSRLTTGDLVYDPDGCPTTGLGSIAVVVCDRLLVVLPDSGARLVPFRLTDTAQGWRLGDAG